MELIDMIDAADKNQYCIRCMNGVQGIMQLPEKSIKLVYGSPPYPNALKSYGGWGGGMEYINKLSPFIDALIPRLADDGFLVICIKACRDKADKGCSSERSLDVERLAIMLKDKWHLHCVDIEIWVKANPVPTGLRAACQDAYEQILWFSRSPRWSIDIEAIRQPYSPSSKDRYSTSRYKPRENGNEYVKQEKTISANPKGALPRNVVFGAVASGKSICQATQPLYLPEKYINACTRPGDLVCDPWMGSGTTGEAAMKMGRRFIGFDTIQSYVDEAEERIYGARKG